MSDLAILCVRNEAAFLLDWLAHHQTVGFRDFLVFSNDCTDGTHEMLDRLQQLGMLCHVPNPGPYHQRGIQFTALNSAAKHPSVQSAGWILTLDIDEFVNIHVGDGSLHALKRACPDADAITLTWRLFGNAGQVRFEDVPIPDQFVHAAPEVMYWPWRAAMFKTFYANDGTYQKPGVHRPRAPRLDRLEQCTWYDGHGRVLPALFKTKRLFSPFGQPNYGLAQINHYALGAMESFVLKADRGRAVHGDQALGLDYWTERNWNQERDLSIERYAEARRARKADFMKDPVLSRLHGGAVAWRRAKFESLMREEPSRALFGRLMMSPSARALSAVEAQRLHRFAVPDRSKQ